MIGDIHEDDKKERAHLVEKYGNRLNYTGDACKKCGRHRVELYSTGKKICEKCHLEQETGEYAHELFHWI